jgi:alpha-tubulin suppressor-like RCC1 family protein
MWALALAGCSESAVGSESDHDGESCPEPIVDVELGHGQTCMLGESGRLRCFGRFDWLQEWVAAEAPLWELPWIEFPSAPVFVSNSGTKLCVLLEDGGFECDRDDEGFIGQPIELKLDADPIAIFSDPVDQWLLLDDGRWLRYAKLDGSIEVQNTPAPFVQVDVSVYHRCAVTQDGVVACMGANNYGQLGLPGVEWSDEFVLLPVTGAHGVATGLIHTCAWFETGEYACWGTDNGGVLGNGALDEVIGDDETLDGLERHALDGAIVQMEANERATCARLDDGGVRCWGSGPFVQLSLYNETTDETTSVHDPLAEPRIPLPEPAIDIDLGEWHACAAGLSGAVYCWGFKPAWGETNSWSVDGYLDGETGLVRAMQLESSGACAIGRARTGSSAPNRRDAPSSSLYRPRRVRASG